MISFAVNDILRWIWFAYFQVKTSFYLFLLCYTHMYTHTHTHTPSSVLKVIICKRIQSLHTVRQKKRKGVCVCVSVSERERMLYITNRLPELRNIQYPWYRNIWKSKCSCWKPASQPAWWLTFSVTQSEFAVKFPVVIFFSMTHSHKQPHISSPPDKYLPGRGDRNTGDLSFLQMISIFLESINQFPFGQGLVT